MATQTQLIVDFIKAHPEGVRVVDIRRHYVENICPRTKGQKYENKKHRNFPNTLLYGSKPNGIYKKGILGRYCVPVEVNGRMVYRHIDHEYDVSSM